MLLVIDLLGGAKTLLTFLLVLSVLVTVHEWGHFIVAKLCGMRVEDFSLFFGKRLIRLGVRNGTEYNIRSVPLGGFVKIAGMEPDDLSNGTPLLESLKQSRDKLGWGSAKRSAKLLRGLSTETLAEIDMEQLSPRALEAVEQAVENGLLTPDGKAELRMLLVGATLNADEQRYLEAVLAADDYQTDPHSYNQKPLWQRAAVIFAGPFMSILFGYVLFCTLGFTSGLPEAEKIKNIVGEVSANKPAEKAGLKKGDRIIQMNSVPIRDGEQMVEIIHNSIDKPLHLIVLRGKDTLQMNATPYGEVATVLEKDKPITKRIGRLGFQVVADTVLKRYSVVESVRRGTIIIVRSVQLMFISLFSSHIRDSVGGPVAIVGQVHEARQEGTVYVFILAASLSISLGIINLFPIPIMDGGQLMLLAVEGIRRRKLSSREVYTAQMFGLSIILTLFVLVMYNDISRYFPHGKP